MKKLYLASKSPSRKYLLTIARIPFETILQDANEEACDWTLPLEQLVVQIAESKMDHAMVPAPIQEGEEIFIVTADSMCADTTGKIFARPVDRADAIFMLKSLRNGSKACTGLCIQKRVARNGTWEIVQRLSRCVTTEAVFIVPDQEIERYFREHPIALQSSGAAAVEDFGMQYLKSVHGSVTNIIGLPLFELREELEKMGFFA